MLCRALGSLAAPEPECPPYWQALVALRRVLLAQFSAFPLNGADLYEELKTSTAILSTGIGRFYHVGILLQLVMLGWTA